MNISNQSVLKTQERDFKCCCDIQWKHFEIIGEPVLELVNCILTVPTSLAATLGNWLVFIAIWRTPSLHTPSNILLLSLALTDLGVGLTTPLYFASIVGKIERNAATYCSFKAVYNISSHVFGGVSIVTLTAIGVDRFLALRLHLRYKELVTVRKVTIAIAGMWIAGVLYEVTRIWSFAFNAYLVAAFLLICITVTVLVYCYIYLEVRRHKAHINSQTPVLANQGQVNAAMEYEKSFSNTLLIHFVFLLCYGPYLVVRVLLMFSDAAVLYSVLEFTGALVHINSTLNPVVYCWRFQGIRVAVKGTARKYLPCDRQDHLSMVFQPQSTNA